ncbi:hypothetical protein NEMBOFW57_007915 [Staphylotrichum longicolle]|uniref:Uncharacterized protein n=1 Tax=Staphylotrichum longicolle TaxID=669026 RepID=A0AAD4F009_9PEZI|nr:hypothetical protein NEMBOFW57_007915 [Staphylotrichum longicolle]
MELKRPALGDPVPDPHCNPTWKAALLHNIKYQVAFRCAPFVTKADPAMRQWVRGKPALSTRSATL